MRLYWAKIILGALAIFAIGMVIKKAVDSARDHVTMITDSAEPLTIPFPFGIMPFRLDGNRLGNVERLTLLRDSPKGISNFQVHVKLADSVSPDLLRQCLLVFDDPENINENSTFRCQAAADTGGLTLVPYGEVSVEGVEGTFPILLTEAAIADLRSEDATDQFEASADSVADEMEAYADSMGDLADSITNVNMEMADSIRAEAMHRADSIRESALRMADSIRQARRSAPPRPRRPRR